MCKCDDCRITFEQVKTHIDTTEMKVLKCSKMSSLSAHTDVQNIPTGNTPHIRGHFLMNIFVTSLMIDKLHGLRTRGWFMAGLVENMGSNHR